MKKRMLSLLLCLMMVLSLLPTMAFATGGTPVTSVAVTGVQTPTYGAVCSVSDIVITTDPADAFQNSFVRWAKVVDASETFMFNYESVPYRYMTESETFGAGTYRLFAVVDIKEMYDFGVGFAATINGAAATVCPIDSEKATRLVSAAITVEAPTPTEITSVSITGLKVPEVGTTIGDFLTSAKVPAGANYSIMGTNCYFKDGTEGITPMTTTFESGKEYYFGALIYSDTGYTFGDSTAASTADIAKASQTVEYDGEQDKYVLKVNTVTFTPTAPATEFDLWVGGKRVTSTNKDDVLGDGGKVKYDPAANKLTLDGAVIHNPSGGGILSNIADLAVVVTGNVTITADESQGILTSGGLKLTVNSDSSVTIGSPGDGIRASTNIEINGNGCVDITSLGSNGILTEGDVIIAETLGITTPADSIVKAGTVYENDGTTVAKQVVIAPKTVYTMTAGADSVWVKGTTTGLTFTSNAPFAKFANSVKVDGTDVPAAAYTAAEGSTRITMNPSYLDSLTVGEHTIAIVSTDGQASAAFRVIEPATISITKSFGGDLPTAKIPTGATFTVRSQDGTFSESRVLGTNFREERDGSRTTQFKVAPGNYTVTETAYTVDGYTATVSYKVGTGETRVGDTIPLTDVGAGDTIDIFITDSYTENVTVTFEMNGHGTQVPAQTFAKGGKATKPTDPTASGYTFGGWYADAAFAAQFDFDAAVNANTTVYAKWTQNAPAPANYTVTFNMNGHGTQIASQTVKAGEKATKPTDPTASGYTFGGWYTDSTLATKFDFASAINADTTVYAKWTKNASTGTVQSGDNSNMSLWVALLSVSIAVLAGTAAVGTVVYGKKGKYSE